MKNILATTALALVLSGGSFAAMAAPLNAYQSQQDDISASDIIDMRIYATETMPTGDVQTGAEKEWDDVGEVNDVILSRDGQVKAAIIGVGGFLGMGEKDVAVPMTDLKFVRNGDGADDYFLVINANKESLTNATAYVRPADKAQQDASATAADPAATDVTGTDMTATAPATDTTTTTPLNDTAANSTTTTPPADDAANTTADSTTATPPAADAADTAANTNSATDETTTSSTNVTPGMNDADRTLLPRPEVTRDGYATMPVNEVTAAQLEGATVYGPGDENVGEINRVILSTDGKVERVVLDVGGFLGMGERQIAVTMDELNIVKNSAGDDFRVYVDSNEANLKAQPAYTGG